MSRIVPVRRAYRRLALVVALLAALAGLDWRTSPVDAHAEDPAPVPASEPAPLSFVRSGYLPLDVERKLQPWQQMTPAAQLATGLDANGVAMVTRPDGQVYDHPVRQAQWGFRCIRTWRHNGDAAFLASARTQADRLITRHVEARGAWWYPYDFAFSISAERISYTEPWYSGMAQGEVLGLFSQLADVLADIDPEAAATYRHAADMTFRSLQLGPEEKPWVSMTDDKGYLWIQEYPQDPPSESDFTYNGFGFAAYGLYDYWHLTRSSEAATLFDGAVTTLAHALPSFRRPAWASIYGLRGQRPHTMYTVIHTDQLLKLQWLTGKDLLAAYSDVLETDYPAPVQSGQVNFAPATHALVKFRTDGSIAARGTLRLARASSAPTDRRARQPGTGYWYRITRGAAAGWWVQESTKARLGGIRLLREYHPGRPFTYRAGLTYRLVTYDGAGRVTGSALYRPTADVRSRYGARALVNGTYWVRVATSSSSSSAGRWVSLSEIRRS